MEVFRAGHLFKQGKEILLKATSSKDTSFLKREYRAECPTTQQMG